jgi:hypothetical protein
MFVDGFFKACADKLRMEMEDYGYPPVFPEEKVICQPSEQNRDEPVVIDKSKGKKVIQTFFELQFHALNIITLAYTVD